MIETTMDLQQVENHEFMIKPDFDDDLKGRDLLHNLLWFVSINEFLSTAETRQNKVRQAIEIG